MALQHVYTQLRNSTIAVWCFLRSIMNLVHVDYHLPILHIWLLSSQYWRCFIFLNESSFLVYHYIYKHSSASSTYMNTDSLQDSLLRCLYTDSLPDKCMLLSWTYCRLLQYYTSSSSAIYQLQLYSYSSCIYWRAQENTFIDNIMQILIATSSW